MKKIYKKDGSYDIESMVKDGWKYRMFPWTHKIIYDEMFKIVNEEDIVILSTNEMVENTSGSSFTKIKGTILISDKGIESINNWMQENADLISKESPSGELH